MRMFVSTKTIVLPLDATINVQKQRELDKLSRRITFAVSLFLEISRTQNVFGKKKLEQYRHTVEDKTQLPSGIVQACRDQVAWMTKDYPKKRSKWQKKVKKLEKDIVKLEQRKRKHEIILQTASDRAIKTKAKSQRILANTIDNLAKKREVLARLQTKEPKFPSIKKPQVINFDARIGSFEKAEKTTSIDFWVNVSGFTKRKRLQLPVQSYAWANRYLEDEAWQQKSFRLVWNRSKKRYFVHLMLEKEVIFRQLLGAYGLDPGMKRLIYASCDLSLTNKEYEAIKEEIVVLGSHPRIRPLLGKLKKLSNRIARLQRLGKLQVLKRLRNKRYRVARQLRYVIASVFVRELPDDSVLVALGLPKKIREHQGQRAKNYANLKAKSSKKHRKRLHHWSYKALVLILEQKLLENHHLPIIVTEAYTTQRCHECESLNSEIHDRDFRCLDCGFEGDRDANASDNIRDNGLYELLFDLIDQHYVLKKTWLKQQKQKKKKKKKKSETKRFQEHQHLQQDVQKQGQKNVPSPENRSEVTAHVSDVPKNPNTTNKSEKLPVATNLSAGSPRISNKRNVGGRPCEPSLNMRKPSLLQYLVPKKDLQPEDQIIGQPAKREQKDLVPSTSEA